MERTRVGESQKGKAAKRAEPEAAATVRPSPADLPAQILGQQRTVGNRAVQRNLSSGVIDGRAVPAAPRQHAPQPVPPAASTQAASPIQHKPEQHARIQRAWYNFDIPFTNYQFDPSISGIKTAAGLVKEKAEEAVDWIIDEIKDLVNSGIEWLSEKWDSLKELAAAGWETLKATFANIVGFIKSPLNFLADAITNFDADSLAKAWSSFTGIVTTLSKTFELGVGNLVKQVGAVWDRISSFADTVLDRVTGLTENFVFRRLPDAVQSIAFSLIEKLRKLWKGIEDGWNKVFGTIKAWVDAALQAIVDFVRRVLSFGIVAVIEGIRDFGKLVLFLRDLMADPMKYVEILANKGVQALEGVESRFAGVVAQYFGSPAKAAPAAAKAAPAATATTTIQRQPAAPAVTPAPAAVGAAKRTATWGEIGNGILGMMGKKWDEFKANPLSVLKGLLIDMVFPIIGDVKDIIQLFKDIKKIVTAPFSAGSLQELWTSILQILDIPILIYKTVVSILMRTLMVPLIVASFVPHPVVKGIAAAVGYALLGAFVQGEVANVAHKVLLLKTGLTDKGQKEDAYNRIADSFIALAMTAVIIIIMLILHFMANVVKGVYNFVKGKVFGIEPTPLEGKGQAEPTPEKPADKPIDAQKIVAEEPTADGKHKIRVTEGGECLVCTDCALIRQKYAAELDDPANAKLKADLDAAEKLTDPVAKAKEEARIEPLLRALREKRLAIDPQSGKTNPKSSGEAASIMQAEDQGLVKGKARRPDLDKGEPNLDFIMEDADGKTIGYVDVKTPVDPKFNPIPDQAADIAGKVNLYDPDVKVIVDLKNLPPPDKATFKAELAKKGADMKKIIFLND